MFVHVGGAIAGAVGFHRVDRVNGSSSLGYWLASAAQGRGTVTLAAAALVEWAFSGPWQLHRLEIRAGTENERSRAIPERLGFRHEGTRRGAEKLGERWIDHAVYGLLADEWSGYPRALTPEPLVEPRCPGHRPGDGVADRGLVADEHEPFAGPGGRGVEQLAAEDLRAGLGQDHRDRLELGALALVDRHRVDGLDGAEAARRVQRRLAAALEAGHQAARGALGPGDRDDDAGVSVVEPELVVVLGHQQRPSEVPPLGDAQARLVGQPAFDPGRPAADPGAAATVRAQDAKARERRQCAVDIPRPCRLEHGPSGTDGFLAQQRRHLGAGRIGLDPAHGAFAAGRAGAQQLDRRVAVAGPDRGGQLGDRAPKAVAAVEHHDRLGRCPRRARPDDVAEHRAGLDRGQLPGVADEHEPGVGAQRLDQPGHQRQRDHRGLVDDHHVVGQPPAAIVAKAAVGVRAPAEQTVDRGGLGGLQRGPDRV